MNTAVIICNDPQIALVKDAIQPLLVTKLGIVPDFDAGLKEVFDKRPPLVFIQSEIAGVRAETVIRHIKSLLQTNSPQFIYLYSSADDAANRGAVEYINLSQPDEELIAQFKEHLQTVPGIRWKEQPPAQDVAPAALPPQDEPIPEDIFSFDQAEEESGPAVPEPAVAEIPAEEDIFSFDQPTEPAPAEAPPVVMEEDDIFSFFTAEEAQAAKLEREQAIFAAGEPLEAAPEEPVETSFPEAAVAEEEIALDEEIIPEEPESEESEELFASEPDPTPTEEASELPEPLPEDAAEPPLEKPVEEPALQEAKAVDLKDLPLAMEGDSSSRRSKLLILGGILLAVVCAVAFYLLSPSGDKHPKKTGPPKQALPPGQPAPAKPAPPVTAPEAPAKVEPPPAAPAKPAVPAAAPAPAPPVAPGTPAKPPVPGTPATPGTPAKPGTPGTPATPTKPATPGTPATPATPGTPATPATPGTPATPAKPAAPAAGKPAPATAAPIKELPAFIPKEGRDPAYGAAKPGWERFTSQQREYLVFREHGAVRAIQIIALQQKALDADAVTSILRDLGGDGALSISSRSNRDGYLIEQGLTSNKAEVLIYKKKGSGETRGVVISLP